MSEASSPLSAATVARQLAEQLQSRNQEYALGGAIALGYWGEPRGTVDVDVTLFMPPERPSECVWLLQDIGCQLAPVKAAESLRARLLSRDVRRHGRGRFSAACSVL